MEVQSIKYNTIRHSAIPNKSKQDCSVNLCRENNIESNNVTFSGSEARITSEAAAKVYKNLGNTFFDKIGASEKFKRLLEIFEENTVIASQLVALVVAGVLRPATNMLMAGKNDKEDSMHAAAHAIASAIIGVLISTVVMLPFDKAFKKIKENPKKYLTGLEETLKIPEIGRRKLEKSVQYKKISKMAQMIPDSLIMGVPKAMLTIALIPPILKYVFGFEKTSKKPESKGIDNYSQNFINKTVFCEFKGGNK